MTGVAVSKYTGSLLTGQQELLLDFIYKNGN